MIVKKGNKYYQVKFKHKKVIQSGGGVQDYLLTYFAALTANELRKLLKFISAYSRAKDREDKIKLFQQYKDTLFSIETLEEPAIALMIPFLLSSLKSSKNTDDDSKSTTSTVKTSTSNISNMTQKLKNKFSSWFGLNKTDKPALLTTGNIANVPNTIGNDPVSNQQFVSGQTNITASGKRIGRPPKEPSTGYTEKVDLPQLSQEQLEAIRTEKEKLDNALEASFSEFDVEKAQKQAQKQAQVKQGKELLEMYQKKQATKDIKYPQFKKERAAQLRNEGTILTGKERIELINKEWNNRNKPKKSIIEDYAELQRQEKLKQQEIYKERKEFEKIDKEYKKLKQSGKGLQDFFKKINPRMYQYLTTNII